MSKRIVLRFEGIGSISFNAHDAMLADLGTTSVEELQAKDFSISRRGVEFVLPGAQNYRSFHYTPAGIRDLTWPKFFDGFGLPATARFADRDAPISYIGAVAGVLSRTWCETHKAALQEPKGRGRPKRNQDWNQDREELFASILERQRNREENVVDSIESVSKVDAARFSRAFKGRTMQAKRHSARQYFYSRKRDTR